MDQKHSDWISGIVIRGDGRGRDLGFPTANLRLEHAIERPEDGIYACWVKIQGQNETLKGVMHVGPRPTIEGALPSVEIHILETPHLEIYNQTVSFKIVKYIRGVEKFHSLEALTAAIKIDCDQARAVLQQHSEFI